MEDNLLSVYIVTYNRAKYLKKAIESVLNQTFQEFNFYVIDNCSTDDTEQIVKSFNNSNINFISHPENIGGLGNINFAIMHNNSKYFVVLHDDDIICPDFLQQELEFMESHPKCAVVACKVNTINDKDFIIKPANLINAQDKVYKNEEMLCEYLKNQDYLPFPTCMYRSSFMKENNILLDKIAGPSADMKMILDIAKNSGILCKLNKALMNYRIHENQDSYINRASMLSTFFKYLHSDNYYKNLMHKYRNEEKAFFKYLVFDEACLLAKGQVTAPQAKNDINLLYKHIHGNIKDKLIFNTFWIVYTIAPRFIKKLYLKLKRS